MFKLIESRIMNRYGTSRKNWAGGLEIIRKFSIFNYAIQFRWRSPEGMGRFGGGWNFKLGMISGSATTVIDLIFFSIRIEKKKVA